jgi:hypothetical protein
MNTDLELFSTIINHLVYLTTKDEFGNKRTRGVGTYDHYAEELNQEHIVPKTGHWTENSLKLFFSRIMKKYPEEVYKEACDIDFTGRRCWEYLSYTKSEEVVEGRNLSKKDPDEYENGNFSKNTIYSALNSDVEFWKKHELGSVELEDKKILKIYKNSKKGKRISKSTNKYL